MALNTRHHLTLPAVFVFILFLFIFTTSSARRLNDFHSLAGGIAATHPTLNLALPLHNGAAAGVADESETSHHQNLPCDHRDININNNIPMIKNSPVVGISLRSPRLAGKYGPMILSMLPRGPVPSSGPSRGTNDVKN